MIFFPGKFQPPAIGVLDYWAYLKRTQGEEMAKKFMENTNKELERGTMGYINDLINWELRDINSTDV